MLLPIRLFYDAAADATLCCRHAAFLSPIFDLMLMMPYAISTLSRATEICCYASVARYADAIRHLMPPMLL